MESDASEAERKSVKDAVGDPDGGGRHGGRDQIGEGRYPRNPKPEARNPKPETRTRLRALAHPTPETRNQIERWCVHPKHETRHPERLGEERWDTRNTKPEARNAKPETRNFSAKIAATPGTRNPKHEYRKPEPQTPNPKPGTRKPNHETRNPKPQTPNPEQG
ncbi:hypothetical protein T484DRAFT_1747868 [Baffinella frigidus]|nr:hypothetical protein T484DRAFT_1747868 [Cryptophyta sp. CCMP2293]